jgi:four helix bundle protein
MQDPHNLRVWHLAEAIALKVIKAFPEGSGRKVPGLRGQMIRAATSIPFNIAEGCRRGTRPQLLASIEVALGSNSELESQLRLAHAAGVLDGTPYRDLQRDSEVLRRMLFSLRRTLGRRIGEDERGEREGPDGP